MFENVEYESHLHAIVHTKERGTLDTNIFSSKGLHYARKTSLPSKEVLATQSSSLEWRGDIHGLSWTIILKCLATQMLLGEKSTVEELHCGVASSRRRGPRDSELAAVIRAAMEERR